VVGSVHPQALRYQTALTSVHSGEEPAAPPPCRAEGPGAPVRLPSRLGHRIRFWSCCWWWLVTGLVRQLAAFALRKGIVVEAVSNSKLSFWVGRSIHSMCKVLPPYLQHRCLERAGYLNTLAVSLNEWESNLYPGGKMDHCKDNAEIKHAGLGCYQRLQIHHNPFQPFF